MKEAICPHLQAVVITAAPQVEKQGAKHSPRRVEPEFMFIFITALPLHAPRGCWTRLPVPGPSYPCTRPPHAALHGAP